MHPIFFKVVAFLGLIVGAEAASVRAISFTLPEEVLAMEAHLANASEPVPLTVKRGNLSTGVDLQPGPYNLTIPSLSKSTKFVIPETGSSTYLLLVFVTANTPLSVVLVPDGSDKIPYGTYYIINAYDKDVGVVFDKQKVVLKPAKSHVFSVPKLDQPDNYFNVELSAIYGNFKVPTPFIRSAWESWQDRRIISLIFSDPAYGRPLVRSIPDLKEIPEEPAP